MFYPLEGAQEAAQVSAMLADLLGTSPTPSRQFTQAVNEHKKMTLRIQVLWHYFSFVNTEDFQRHQQPRNMLDFQDGSTKANHLQSNSRPKRRPCI